MNHAVFLYLHENSGDMPEHTTSELSVKIFSIIMCQTSGSRCPSPSPTRSSRIRNSFVNVQKATSPSGGVFCYICEPVEKKKH